MINMVVVARLWLTLDALWKGAATNLETLTGEWGAGVPTRKPRPLWEEPVEKVRLEDWSPSGLTVESAACWCSVASYLHLPSFLICECNLKLLFSNVGKWREPKRNVGCLHVRLGNICVASSRSLVHLSVADVVAQTVKIFLRNLLGGISTAWKEETTSFLFYPFHLLNQGKNMPCDPF